MTPGMPKDASSDSELSQFLLQACHDLRGPLRAIRTHAELLVRNDAGREESVGFVVGGVTAAGKVVDGLTEYALALALDPASFHPVPLDVIVRAAMAKLAAQIRQSEAEIIYDSLPTVTGDWDRLQQLFEYLLDRALRQPGANRPAIEISAEAASSGAWQLTVRDNGAEMDEESLQKAFVPFARLHINQRPGPGLAVCRAIVEKHGGTIWAEPSTGGCLFHFTLPGE